MSRPEVRAERGWGALFLILSTVLVICICFIGWQGTRIVAVASGLEAEMVETVDEMISAATLGEWQRVENATWRLWRLSNLYQSLTPFRPYGEDAASLAADLSDLAAGWRERGDLQPEDQSYIRLHLITLREMLTTRDFSHAETVLVWLQGR